MLVLLQLASAIVRRAADGFVSVQYGNGESQEIADGDGGAGGLRPLPRFPGGRDGGERLPLRQPGVLVAVVFWAIP